MSTRRPSISSCHTNAKTRSVSDSNKQRSQPRSKIEHNACAYFIWSQKRKKGEVGDDEDNVGLYREIKSCAGQERRNHLGHWVIRQRDAFRLNVDHKSVNDVNN